MNLKACLFDLDGVIVDTAKYHFVAWQKLANDLGIDFTPEENENLKGVSRMESLDYILNLGNLEMEEEKRNTLAYNKNEHYKTLIRNMDESEILPGVVSFLEELKAKGIKIGLGSSSKNAQPILEKINLISYFEVIIDGTKTTRSKPDPQVFQMGAEGLDVAPENTVVFEDAVKGVAAAKVGGFMAIGIGEKDVLDNADHVIPGFSEFSLVKLNALYS